MSIEDMETRPSRCYFLDKAFLGGGSSLGLLKCCEAPRDCWVIILTRAWERIAVEWPQLEGEN